MPSPTQGTQRLSPKEGRQTIKRLESSALTSWYFAQQCFFRVFCGEYANALDCLSRVTELEPSAPAGTSGGPRPRPGLNESFSHQRRRCHPPIPWNTHRESMSLKFQNTFPIPTNPEYNWFEELLKMLSGLAGQGLKTLSTPIL